MDFLACLLNTLYIPICNVGMITWWSGHIPASPALPVEVAHEIPSCCSLSRWWYRGSHGVCCSFIHVAWFCRLILRSRIIDWIDYILFLVQARRKSAHLTSQVYFYGIICHISPRNWGKIHRALECSGAPQHIPSVKTNTTLKNILKIFLLSWNFFCLRKNKVGKTTPHCQVLLLV